MTAWYSRTTPSARPRTPRREPVSRRLASPRRRASFCTCSHARPARASFSSWGRWPATVRFGSPAPPDRVAASSPWRPIQNMPPSPARTWRALGSTERSTFASAPRWKHSPASRMRHHTGDRQRSLTASPNETDRMPVTLSDDAQHDIFAQTGYLLLEEALGEYDMETRVGAIAFGGVKSEHRIVIRS